MQMKHIPSVPSPLSMSLASLHHVKRTMISGSRYPALLFALWYPCAIALPPHHCIAVFGVCVMEKTVLVFFRLC